MKKWMLLAVLELTGAVLHAQQKDISGKWVGRFGGQSTLVFHFKKTGDSLSGTFDSPRENAFGIPLSTVTPFADTVAVTVKQLRASFKGRLTGDTAISGSWLQGAAILPITFIKTPELRPQLPVPPFSYNSEEVAYDNADKSVHFGGTFTYPKKGGSFITVILITGSGQEDRDETIMGHKPFAVIADHLTKNGYAVLRMDDRGVGKTSGTLEGVTSVDFAKDVEAAIDYVKNRKEVNAGAIGLIGHSEGGLIANIVGAQRPDDVQFIISLAGPGVKGAVLMAEQNEKILTKQGVPAPGVAFYKGFIRQVMDSITLESDSVAIYRRANLVFNKLKQATPDSVIASLGIFSDMQAGMLMRRVAGNLAGSWMKYFITSNPAFYIEQLRCKYLALNGSEDVQVTASLNLAGIEAALKKSKSTGFAVKEIKGVNHLFQHCKLCTVAEYGDLEETFAPDALDVITEWLNGHVK
jgi:alpha/beta superfamily hydrolase